MRARRAAALAALLAVVAPVVPALLIAGSWSSFDRITDLPRFFAAAKMMVAGQGKDIYRLPELASAEQSMFPRLGERVMAFYYPPLALPWLLPLAAVPARLAPWLWTGLLLASTGGSLFALQRAFALGWTEVLCLWAVLSVSGPLYESVRIGQLGPVLMCAFCLAIWALRGDRPVVAALAMSFLLLKPHEILPFLAYLFGAGRKRALLSLAVVAGVLAAVSWLLVGGAGWSDYLEFMRSPLSVAEAQPQLHATVRGQLLRLFPRAGTAVTIFSAAVCGVAVFLIWRWGRLFGRGERWLQSGLLLSVPLGLVTALYCHDYDLLLLAPSAVVLVKSAPARALPDWLKLAAIAAGTVLLLPLYLFVHYDYLLPGGPVNPLFCVLLAYAVGCAALVLRNAEDIC